MTQPKFKSGDRVFSLSYSSCLWCEVVPGNTLTILEFITEYNLYKVIRDGFKFPVWMKESDLSLQ
jgi:hypothetical protein